MGQKMVTERQAAVIASEIAAYAHWRFKQWGMRFFIPNNFLLEDRVITTILDFLIQQKRISKTRKEKT